MNETEEQPVKRKPYPWHCPNCRNDAAYPAKIDYTANVRKDGIVHTFVIHDFEVAKCSVCETLLFSNDSDPQVEKALQAHLRTVVLQPEQIRNARQELGLSEGQLAAKLGVAEELISRWETEAITPPRAMDNLLRLYFGIPAVREALKGTEQDPHFGTVVITESTSNSGV